VFGGSWGSTLALAYAQAHPNRCRALVLRGIFLGGETEIDWFLHGIGRFFPEAYRAFVEAIPAAERDDLLGAYYRRLTGDDRAARRGAALAWSRYEGSCSTLLPSQDTVLNFSELDFAERLARIEAHYFVNRLFVPEGGLLAGVESIRHVPAVIVQGRYDMVCPIITADRLARAWPEATYDIVADAGHAALEPGIRRALISATERFKRLA
jgi:proline iminopeptidase